MSQIKKKAASAEKPVEVMEAEEVSEAEGLRDSTLVDDSVEGLDGGMNVETVDGDSREAEEVPLPTYDLDSLGGWNETVESGESKGVVSSDPLQRYLAEIRHFPILSREEEHELAVKYFQLKDQRAGYRLVMANLRLVVMIAREYQRNVQNVLDLVQEGNIGLLEAVDQYDPFRGIRFPSYAVYWVRAYMLRYLINNVRLVKVGTTQAQRKLFFNLQKEKERLESEGFVPEAKLLAERLKVKESEVIEMQQRLALPDLSVDASVAGSGGELDLHGILPSQGDSAEEVVVREQFSDALRGSVEKFKAGLDAKEKAIIDRRLFTEDPVTLQEIADEFQLSRERIRQIESRLKNRLKEHLKEDLALGEEGEVDISGE